MPLDLPPAMSQLSAAQASPLSQQLPRRLGEPYARTLEAWGGRWQGAQVQVAGATIPTGLQAMLDRHNPTLTQALSRQGHLTGSRFVWGPTVPAESRDLRLRQADRQVLDLLVDRGFLSRRPNNEVLSGAEGSEAGLVFSRLGQISLSGSPQADLGLPLTFEGGVDPVALRWVALSHEAAHLQQATLTDPFEMPGWSSEQNKAMNRLFFTTAVKDSMTAEVYAESFADAYGAMMALALSDGAPGMRQTLSAFQGVRTQAMEANQAQMSAALARGETPYAVATEQLDEHRTSPALDHLLSDFDQGVLNLSAMTPAQMQVAARGYASESVVSFHLSQAGQALNELAWAHGQAVRDAPADPGNDPLRNQEQQRINGYLATRLAAFAYAASEDQVASPLPQTDPMLARLAAQDATFRAAFWKMSENDRATVARSLDQGKLEASPGINAFWGKLQAASADLWNRPDVQREVRVALASDADQVSAALRAASSRTLGERMRQLHPDRVSVSKPSTSVAMADAPQLERRRTP